MTVECAVCGGPVNPFDQGAWKEVRGWVHGPRKDSMTLREDTGRYAHTPCIEKQKKGQPVDQPDLFGEEDVPTLHDPESATHANEILGIDEAFEILDEYHARVCIGENDGRCKCP